MTNFRSGLFEGVDVNFYDLTKGFEFAGILSNTYNDLDNISLVAVSKYEIPVNTNFLTTLGMCFLVVTVEASPPELYENLVILWNVV